MSKPTFGASSKNSPPPKKRKEAVALWEKKGKDGNIYFSMRIRLHGKEVNIRAFKNGKKDIGSTQPDYIAYVEED